MNLFMIDIESTGVDQDNDDIIEIGIAKMIKRNEFYQLENSNVFHMILHTDKKPSSPFAVKHMQELYDKANKVEKIDPNEVRSRIIEWMSQFGDVGSKNVSFCGWNSSTFDTPFMVKKGYLIPSGYDSNDNLIGDFHYRPYEISGAIELACDVLGFSRKTVLGMAEDASNSLPLYARALPQGKEHDAVYDCCKQVKLLNGLIKITKGGR